jgi:4-carboxymuconolactone decarboxylase
MTELSPREVELVALGAAMGSNCVPCVEHHIPKAREAGLTDAQIRAAIELADQVRQVPARKVLEVAVVKLEELVGAGRTGASEARSCADLGNAAGKRCC